MDRTVRKDDDLRQRAKYWQERIRVRPKVVRIQKMSRKWASCSSAGTVTLAHDLNKQDKGFQDYVIVHELLHLKVPKHGRVFRALLTAHVPAWREIEEWRSTHKASR